MIKSIYPRIKQFYIFFFVSFNPNWNNEINNILSTFEKEIFYKMDEYDKIHSYKVFLQVKESDILSNSHIYLKLALLHDCGKKNLSFLKRVIAVFKKKSCSFSHEYLGYLKLKEHNLSLATLIKEHHSITHDIFMREFQQLDSN